MSTMVDAFPRACRSRVPNVCAAAEGPPVRNPGTALASTRYSPFYAIDDTRLHWAIFARFMVRKALTSSFRGASQMRTRKIEVGRAISTFRVRCCASPRNDGTQARGEVRDPAVPYLHAQYRAMLLDPEASSDEVARPMH